MPTTGGRGLRYPASSAAPNVAQDIANLANDVDKELPWPWFKLMSSTTTYTFTPGSAGVWETLSGGSGNTLVVPTGRQLNVEFKAPSAFADNGFFHLRLLVAGEVKAAGWWTNTRSPAHLTADHTGTGTVVAVAIQAYRVGAGGGVDCGNLGPAVLRYQVV